MPDSLRDFFLNPNNPVPLPSFLLNLLLTAVLAFLLGQLFLRYGRAISNRKRLASNFMLLAMTTMIIITIVKASLALSLGLVGALSIVRFRSAIKDPEELTYLFIAIAIGLGLGANQVQVTVSGFATIALVLWLQHFRRPSVSADHFLMTLSSSNADGMDLNEMLGILKQHCTKIDLRRFDESPSEFEVAVAVEAKDFVEIGRAREDLNKRFANLHISFLDNAIVV